MDAGNPFRGQSCRFEGTGIGLDLCGAEQDPAGARGKPKGNVSSDDEDLDPRMVAGREGGRTARLPAQ